MKGQLTYFLCRVSHIYACIVPLKSTRESPIRVSGQLLLELYTLKDKDRDRGGHCKTCAEHQY